MLHPDLVNSNYIQSVNRYSINSSGNLDSSESLPIASGDSSYVINPGGTYQVGIGGSSFIGTNGFKSWCVPTVAACQLGHYNHNYSPLVNSPSDNKDAGKLDISYAYNIIAWNEEGWGDFLLDGPLYRPPIGRQQPVFNRPNKVVDFGYYMNTNDIRIDGLGSSVNGRLIPSIFTGLKFFYQNA